jgi:hypothetical protein
VETSYVPGIPATRGRVAALRIQLIAAIGPVASTAGLIWAILQPERITLLHPRGQGFWWLVFEPPIHVVIAGVLFAAFVARPLIADLEAADAAAR